MSGPAELLKARLRTDLKAAMQARRSDEARLLRVVLAAIDNAEAIAVIEERGALPTDFGSGAAEAPRRVLSEQDIADILLAEIAARLDAAADYERLDRPDEAARLTGEVEMVRGYLT